MTQIEAVRRGPKGPMGPSMARLRVPDERLNPLVAAMREMRVAKGFTVEALGKRSGYDPRTIRAWESGAQVPNLRVFQEVCQALNIEIQLVSTSPESHTDPAL